MALAEERAPLGKRKWGCHSTLPGFPKRLNWEITVLRLKIKQRLFSTNRWLEFCLICEDAFVWHSRQSTLQDFHLWARNTKSTSVGPSCHWLMCSSFVNTRVAYLEIRQSCQETSSHFPSHLWTPHPNYQLFGWIFFFNFFSPLTVNSGLIRWCLGKKYKRPHPPAIVWFFSCGWGPHCRYNSRN